MSPLNEGFVQVYTGDGKGKTTAALGLVLRALGQGLRPAVLQFMKSDPSWGEIVTLRKLGVPVRQCGLDHWVLKGEASDEDLAAAAAGFDEPGTWWRAASTTWSCSTSSSRRCSSSSCRSTGVLALMALKPAAVELVITGRRAPDELIAAADLATEMRPLKHYYDAGVQARPGIEF